MKLVLKSDRLIDGTGAAPIPNAAIVVKDGRIAEVTTQDKLDIGEREEADVIEVSGGTLMPGFIEMHTHIHCSAQTDAYTHIMTESDETFIMRGVGAVPAPRSARASPPCATSAAATRSSCPSRQPSRTASYPAPA